MNQYTDDQEEQIEYALRVLIFEILKPLGVIIIFIVIGYPIQAFIAIVTMMSLKPFIGGYHEDTQVKCFIATLTIITGIVYLSVHLNADLISKLILNGVSLYVIWQQAPVLNPQMLLTRPQLIKRNRIIGFSLSTVFSLVSIILYKYTTISNTILWTIVFQALLLFNKRSSDRDYTSS